MNPVWSTSPATRGSTQIAWRATSAGTPCANGELGPAQLAQARHLPPLVPATPTRPT